MQETILSKEELRKYLWIPEDGYKNGELPNDYANHLSRGYMGGMDFIPEIGDILAADDGEVVEIGQRDKYGVNEYRLVLYHPDLNIFTRYMHLNSHDVHKGDRLKRGQKIGHVEEDVSWKHLHFGVTDNHVPIKESEEKAYEFDPNDQNFWPVEKNKGGNSPFGPPESWQTKDPEPYLLDGRLGLPFRIL